MVTKGDEENISKCSLCCLVCIFVYVVAIVRGEYILEGTSYIKGRILLFFYCFCILDFWHCFG